MSITLNKLEALEESYSSPVAAALQQWLHLHAGELPQGEEEGALLTAHGLSPSELRVWFAFVRKHMYTPSPSDVGQAGPHTVYVNDSSHRVPPRGLPGEKYTSPYRGVCLERGKWRAQITFGGRKHFLGTFDDEKQAARAYDRSALQHHGPKAVTNFTYREDSDAVTPSGGTPSLAPKATAVTAPKKNQPSSSSSGSDGSGEVVEGEDAGDGNDPRVDGHLLRKRLPPSRSSKPTKMVTKAMLSESDVGLPLSTAVKSTLCGTTLMKSGGRLPSKLQATASAAGRSEDYSPHVTTAVAPAGLREKRRANAPPRYASEEYITFPGDGRATRLPTESEELVEGAFRLDGPVKKRPSADRVQMKHDVVPVPNPSSFYPPLVSQMMPAPAPQPGPMAPVYFMMTPSGFTPVYTNGLQWGSMVSDGNAPMQQPQPMVVGWMAIPSSAAPSQPMTASYYPSASASMASTPGLTMPSAAPVTVFGLSPSTPQDPMNPPWLDFNSPSKGSMHDSPGVRFGAWGTGETNKKTYKFVLAGTKSPRSGEESASDGEEEDDGTDAATLRKQLKARIRSERSMRNAKRKVDMMLSELRKELNGEREARAKLEAAKADLEKSLRQLKRSEATATMSKIEAEMLYQRARAALTESVAAQRASERQASNAIASLNHTEEMRMDAERRAVLAQELRDKFESLKESAEKNESDMRQRLEVALADAAEIRGHIAGAQAAKETAEEQLREAMEHFGDGKESFQGRWLEATQLKQSMQSEKLELQQRLADTEAKLAAMTDKATQLQEAKALTDEELASVQKTLDEAKERGFFKTSSLLPAGMCVLTTQHGLLDTAFETLQEENRKVRQELTVALHQLSDAQECRRDAEGSRSRLEHEIHRLNRLRGDAEMARSDAERQYRELTQLKDAGVLPPSSPHTRSKSRRTNRSSPRSKHSRRMSVSRLSDNFLSDDSSEKTERSGIPRENWAVKSLKQAQGVLEQSPVFSIKDLETAALAEQHVVNQAKLRNRASTFTMRAFPSDVDSVLTSPVAAGPGRMAPRRKSSPAKQYKRSTSNTDDRGQRSPDDDDSGMGGSATSAVLARSGDTDKIIEGLQAQRDKLEIEREQLEQMLSEERGRRVEAEAERQEMELRVTELREQRVALSSRMSKITADVKWLVDQQHQLQSAKEAAETLGRFADRNPAGNSGDERESKSPEDGGRKKKSAPQRSYSSSKAVLFKDVDVPKGTRVFQLNGEVPVFTGSHVFWTKDGIKAIDPVAAAQAHPSLRPTALDIGDVVFKYTGIMPGAGKIGNDAGFEPVAVELIEEFETEKDTPLAGLRLYGSPLYHAAEMADSVFRHWRPSVMGGSSRGRLTPANDTKKPLTNPRKTLKSEASMKPKPSQKDIIGQTPLTVRRLPNPRYFVVRAPEGKCGSGSDTTTIWPPRVYVRMDSSNPDAKPKFQVQWPCCQQKNLPYRLMKPAHHTNVSVSPLDCQIMDEQ